MMIVDVDGMYLLRTYDEVYTICYSTTVFFIFLWLDLGNL